MKLDHLSASRIKTYNECQLKYHAIYELKMEEDEHPLTRMGSAEHFMFERAVRHAIENKVPVGIGLADPWHYKADACREFSVLAEHMSLMDVLTKNAIDWGYFRNVARTVGVEMEMEFLLPDGTPVQGIIDRLDLWDDEADIIDLKTQQKEFEPEELANNLQARVYNIAVRLKYPQVRKVRVSFWVLRHYVQRVTLSAKDAENDILMLSEKAHSIRACIAPKPTPTKNCKWCPYADHCPLSRIGIKSKMSAKRKAMVITGG